MNFGGIFDFARLTSELHALEQQTAQPDFWNHPQQAARINRKKSSLERDLNRWTAIERQEGDLTALLQLAEEGLFQVFMPTMGIRNPIVGVIGSLQLDVVEARMSSEYGISCTADRLAHVAARWPVHDANISLALPTTGVMQATDTQGRPVLIFESDWVLRYTMEKNPGVTFRETM